MTAPWQRDIGIWNVVMISLILQALLTGDRRRKAMVARAGVVASVLLGVNHLSTLVGGGNGPIRLQVTALVANSLDLGGALLAPGLELGVRREMASAWEN